MPIIIISESSRTIFLVTKFLQAFLHSNLHISFTSLTFAECFFFLSFLFGKKRVCFSRWCLGSCLSVPPLFFSVGCELDPSSQGQRKELCGLQQLVALCPPWSLSSSSDATQFRPFDLKHTHTHTQSNCVNWGGKSRASTLWQHTLTLWKSVLKPEDWNMEVRGSHREFIEDRNPKHVVLIADKAEGRLYEKDEFSRFT